VFYITKNFAHIQKLILCTLSLLLQPLVCSLLIINNQPSVIETLTKNNYERWKEDVEMVLTMMDIEMVMCEPQHPALTAKRTVE
jgi:hypothetical protein